MNRLSLQNSAASGRNASLFAVPAAGTCTASGEEIKFFQRRNIQPIFRSHRPFIPVVFASVDIILWNTFPYTVENPVENVEKSDSSEPVRQHAPDCINVYVNRGKKICITDCIPTSG